MGVRDHKIGPMGGCLRCGSSQARAFSCCQVKQCSWCDTRAAWDTTGTTIVSRPVAPQPAGAVSATEHADLNGGFPHFMAVASAGGEQG